MTAFQYETDNLIYPVTTVVYVESTFPDGYKGAGSGVIAGINDVLTASHVVYDPSHGGLAQTVRVTPGYDPTPLETPYGTYTASTVTASSAYGFNSEVDVAILGFNVSIGTQVGMMWLDPNFVSGNLNITGYPAFYNFNPMNAFGFVGWNPFLRNDNISNFEIHGGNSGGPLWWFDGDFGHVAGVVATRIAGTEIGSAAADVGHNYAALVSWMQSNDYLIGDSGLYYVGTNGNDSRFGSSGGDQLSGEGGDDKITGLDGNDLLAGGRGNDVLDGGTGTDRMYGGFGNDTFVVDSFFDKVVEHANSGFDTVNVSIEFYSLAENCEGLRLLESAGATNATANELNNTVTGNSDGNGLDGADGNDKINGGGGDDTLQGGPGNDSLNGGAHNDVIDGGTDNDLMTGGAGDDRYFVDSFMDKCVEVAGGGVDEIGASISYTLPQNFERLTLGEGWGALSGTGNVGNNVIFGNSDINALSGGAGNDFLGGLGGSDTLNGGAGVDTLEGDEDSDTLNGGADKDFLRGGNSDDTFLIAGTEATTDVFDGGDGTDAILVAGKGAATLASFNASLSNIEMLIGNGNSIVGTPAANELNFNGLQFIGDVAFVDAGSGNDTIIGTAFDNDLRGGAGDDALYGDLNSDTLNGGPGKDQVFGNEGDDTLVIRGSEARTDELEGFDGFDTILVVGSENATLNYFFALGFGIEAWQGNGKALLGDNGDNTLQFTGMTSITGLSYIDGGAGNDQLFGSGFDDNLRGGAGDDFLDGDAGQDRLTGGAGNDRFSYGPGDGADFVADYIHGKDLFLLEFGSGPTLDSFGQTQVGANVVIDFGGGDTLTIANQTIAKLHTFSSDFLFI